MNEEITEKEMKKILIILALIAAIIVFISILFVDYNRVGEEQTIVTYDENDTHILRVYEKHCIIAGWEEQCVYTVKEVNWKKEEVNE